MEQNNKGFTSAPVVSVPSSDPTIKAGTKAQQDALKKTLQTTVGKPQDAKTASMDQK